MTHPPNTLCASDPRNPCIDCNIYEECALRDRKSSINIFRIMFFAIAFGSLSLLILILR